MTRDGVAQRVALALHHYMANHFGRDMVRMTVEDQTMKMANLALDRVEETHDLVCRSPGQMVMVLAGGESRQSRRRRR